MRQDTLLGSKLLSNSEAPVLNEVAKARGQSLAQMALMWVLRDARVTSALIGASRVSQIEENVAGLAAAPLTDGELSRIDEILKD